MSGCNCPDWEPNMREVNAPFGYLTARNPQTYAGYQGKQFVYCPWCGKKLAEVTSEKGPD